MASRKYSRIRPKAVLNGRRPGHADSASADASEARKPSPRASLSMRRAKRVLIVDDDVVFLDVLARLFGRADYRVERARNGAEGLQAALRALPDLVVTDYQMPELDGVELAEGLAARLGERTPPIVMLTGATPPAEPPATIVAVLHKPVRTSELLALADELITARPTADSCRS
ncbi:MAG: response regulator [Deltaproteobacteria bacterium]|jgi:CheY-like chemotaxis protein|nr:response regulator [Deltaproteobacteria bacterium]MBW2531280.1 response regulator [Deltaproteobacteria bacterium]